MSCLGNDEYSEKALLCNNIFIYSSKDDDDDDDEDQ